MSDSTMVFNNWSSIGRNRIVLGIVVVVGLVVGLGVGFYEDALPEHAALAGVLLVGAFGGVVAGVYYKHMERSGIADERSKQITYKATSIAWSAMIVFLLPVTAIATFSDLEIPVVPLVWVAIMGSIVLQELAKEYYRRQM